MAKLRGEKSLKGTSSQCLDWGDFKSLALGYRLTSKIMLDLMDQKANCSRCIFT